MTNRIKRVFKSNKGFTLTELLLSMSLAVLLTGFLILFLNYEMRFIAEIDRTESAKILGDNAIVYIKNELSYCKDLTIYESSDTILTNGADEKIFFIDEGKLYDSNILVSGGIGRALDLQYAISISNETGIGSIKPMLSVEVFVYDRQGNLQYKASETFENITMISRAQIFDRTYYANAYELGTIVVNPHILYTVVTQSNVF